MATLDIRDGIFFENLINPLQFVICGCGGTGGYVVRDLARMISLYNEQYGVEFSMLLIDADLTETKNLARQNFIPSDVGKNKAEVLATRYSAAFGIDIGYIPEYVKDAQNLHNMTYIQGRNTDFIVIGCVDNNKTRHILHEYYRGYPEVRAFLDSGNERHGGQVVFSCKTANAKGDNSIYGTSVSMKDVVELYDLPNNDKLPDELSCAERAVSAPQDIMANMTAANLILNYCSSILDNTLFTRKRALGNYTQAEKLALKKMCCKEIFANALYFDTSTGIVSADYFNIKALNIYTAPSTWETPERLADLLKRFKVDEANAALAVPFTLQLN